MNPREQLRARLERGPLVADGAFGTLLFSRGIPQRACLDDHLVGLLLDSLLVGALGATSLVLLGTGYLAGLFRERFEIHSSLVPPLLCMLLTLFAGLCLTALYLMLGVDGPVSVLIVRDIVLKSVFAFFLGWPLYAGLRRALRPALVEEESRLRRRRQPTVLGA